jgi:hypothetical protein
VSRPGVCATATWLSERLRAGRAHACNGRAAVVPATARQTSASPRRKQACRAQPRQLLLVVLSRSVSGVSRRARIQAKGGVTPMPVRHVRVGGGRRVARVGALAPCRCVSTKRERQFDWLRRGRRLPAHIRKEGSQRRAYFPPSPSANRPGSPLYVPIGGDGWQLGPQADSSTFRQPTVEGHQGASHTARGVDHRSCRRNLGRLRAASACASRSPCLLRSARARLNDSAARSRNPLALRMIFR